MLRTHRHGAAPSRAFGVAAFWLAIVTVITALVWAQDADDVLRIEQPADRDTYAANREVAVLATIDGDLVAAGQDISIDAEVTSDVIAAGQNIQIRAAVGDDVRAAGQFVRVAAPVAGHVVATGQTVKIEQAVGDWAWLSGGDVTVDGNVGGELKVAAKKITINSEVDGNVDLLGENLSLGPDAVIRGDLTWRSENKADMSPQARVEGEFIEKPGVAFDKEDRGSGLIFTLSLIVAVAVLFAVFPKASRAIANRIATRPLASLALGFALLIATPVLALLLLISKIGAWLGLAVLGIHAVMLLLGVLAGLFAVSDLVLRRFQPNPALWQAMAAIFVAVVVVGFLTYVPVAGALLVLAIWLLGTGALALYLAQGYAAARA